MQSPIRTFVALTLVLRDAPISAEARNSALDRLEALSLSHGSPEFSQRLEDFMAGLSQHGDLKAALAPIAAALQ